MTARDTLAEQIHALEHAEAKGLITRAEYTLQVRRRLGLHGMPGTAQVGFAYEVPQLLIDLASTVERIGAEEAETYQGIGKTTLLREWPKLLRFLRPAAGE